MLIALQSAVYAMQCREQVLAEAARGSTPSYATLTRVHESLIQLDAYKAPVARADVDRPPRRAMHAHIRPRMHTQSLQFVALRQRAYGWLYEQLDGVTVRPRTHLGIHI
jgi:hypothetical protein